MADKNQHIIHKISAELTLPYADEQEEQSEQLKKAVQSALENMTAVLDRNFGNAIYRTDYLSVELNIDDGQLSNLSERLEESLKGKMLNMSSMSITDDKRSDAGLQLEKIDPTKDRKQLFSYFLQTGRFPWWGDNDSFSDLEQELSGISAAEWQALISPATENNPNVLPRLAAQFPEDLIRDLIQKISSKTRYTDELLAFIDKIKVLVTDQNPGYGQSQRLMTDLYAKVLEGVIFEQTNHAVIETICDTFSSTFLSVEITAEVWKYLLEASNLQGKGDFLQKLKKRTVEESKERSVADEEQHSSNEEGWSEFEEESLMVANAGIMLLHPFIQRFFANLGLLEKDAFTDEAARERAVCLLHYLAAGDDEFPEPELMLPKFLCGWPLEQPVNRFLPISDYEKDEAESVLRSAIEHWETLKNTSAHALRSTFLQREGLLRKEEFGWSLHIEKQTQDILMEKLPWGLSVVKFPWMDDMLTINWR